MSRFARAAGLSVATLSLAAGLAFAGPTQAETETAPFAARYSDHGAAAPLLNPAVTDGIDAVATQKASADLSAPVLQHAVATMDSSPDQQSPMADAEEESSPPLTLSEMVNAHMSSEVPDSETECLATAVYFESKGEPLSGQLAVAKVIINRSESGRFPSSLCGVVKQRGQFSFVHGGRLPAVAHSSRDWRKAVAISYIAIKGLAKSAAPRALFFHARRVSPHWKLTRVASVGNHVFYR
jgi:spore germination cell wall hydrolase CwlJ-like protein